MNSLSKLPAEEALAFSRDKDRSLLASSAYRLRRLVGSILGPEKELRLLLNLHRILGRLAFESSGVVFAENFHLVTKGINEDLLKEVLSPESTVVDIGCGIGRWSNIAGKYCRSVVGVDFDEKLILQAKENSSNSNVKFIVGDVTSDLPAEKYDFGILSHVIEHIEEVDDFLVKLQGVAKTLLIEVPDFNADSLNRVRLEMGVGFFSDGDHVREYTSETLGEQLVRNGWTIRSVHHRNGCIVCIADSHAGEV